MRSGIDAVLWTKIALTCALITASKSQRRQTHHHHHHHPLVVASILVEPYLMLNSEFRNESDPHNSQYVGYISELLEKLSQLLSFTYVIKPVQDGSYGYLRLDGSWDGIIGEVVNGKASIAAAPIYVTRQRAKVIDFTDVFMTVYATVLMKKTTLSSSSSSSLSSSLLSSSSSDSSHPVMIRSIKDLINQSEIRFGTLNKGVLVRAFKKTNVSTYKLMWRQMQSFQPSVFTQTNEEGIDRIRTQNYAFILPHTIAEYVSLRKPCDLSSVGRFLMHRGYALGVRKDSSLRRPLNDALRRLSLSGFLDKLNRKWWIGRSECDSPFSSSNHPSPADADPPVPALAPGGGGAGVGGVIPRTQKIYRNRAVADSPPNDVIGGSSGLTSLARHVIVSIELFLFLVLRRKWADHLEFV